MTGLKKQLSGSVVNHFRQMTIPALFLTEIYTMDNKPINRLRNALINKLIA
jgi:hypothetical protein